MRLVRPDGKNSFTLHRTPEHCDSALRTPIPWKNLLCLLRPINLRPWLTYQLSLHIHRLHLAIFLWASDLRPSAFRVCFLTNYAFRATPNPTPNPDRPSSIVSLLDVGYPPQYVPNTIPNSPSIYNVIPLLFTCA